MIRKTLTPILVVLFLSACAGGGTMAPVVYKGAGISPASPIEKAKTPLALPPPTEPVQDGVSAPVASVDTQGLSEADELDMLDVGPGAAIAATGASGVAGAAAGVAGGAPSILAPVGAIAGGTVGTAGAVTGGAAGAVEALTPEEELAMLDVEPGGLAPVDLRPKVDAEPSVAVTSMTNPGLAPSQTVAAVVEQEIVQTRDRPASIKVQSGDTLFSLSEKYQVALQPLIDLNNLHEPYSLNKGQTLKLPAPLHYRVQKGDTLYSIARRYQIHFQSLAGINGVEEPYLISPDTILVLPTLSRDNNGQWKAIPVETTTPAPSGKPGPTASAPKPSARPKIIKPSVKSRFLWPLDGPILSQYGSKDGGLRNDGINIKATANAEIHAAGAGTVIYSGSELKNYGRLILIRHSNGWVTAYAHNSDSKVREGAKVTAGQVIALAGSSGAVDEPQLHFETRKGVKPVDPLQHLPKR